MVVMYDAPGDPCQLVGQRGRELVPMHPRLRLLQPGTEGVLLPALGTHQDDIGGLDEQRSQIFAATLGDTSQNRSTAGAVLAGHEADPGAEVASAFERFVGSNRRDHHLDLACHAFDAFIEPEPVCVEADDRIVHARRNLVAALVQDREQSLAQGAHQIAPRSPARSEKRGSD